MPRELKVYGIATHTNMRLGQWRYVAAVYSINELALLLGTYHKYVKDYSSETRNEEEIKLAMASPHQLIPIRPLDYPAKQAHSRKLEEKTQ